VEGEAEKGEGEAGGWDQAVCPTRRCDVKNMAAGNEALAVFSPTKDRFKDFFFPRMLRFHRSSVYNRQECHGGTDAGSHKLLVARGRGSSSAISTTNR